MHGQSRVRDPGVRGNARACIENREKGGRAVICHVALGCAFEHFGRARTSRQMLRLRYALVP